MSSELPLFNRSISYLLVVCSNNFYFIYLSIYFIIHIRHNSYRFRDIIRYSPKFKGHVTQIFLLVFHCNYVSILHHCWNIITYSQNLKRSRDYEQITFARIISRMHQYSCVSINIWNLKCIASQISSAWDIVLPCLRHPTFIRFIERELTFTFAICYRPSVCRLSVTFVHPT